ncbi:DMT family transporter [Saccharospirillum mangrovi]|uniref:DMT family transporter n=1 Tax=Saccharospirillum mangrovi TaxID=2161747 RepID=UPI000D3D3D26|nr:SMR family transporter [Saccharospirillum mangrovi]
MKAWLILAVAICAEVVATSALKASENFSRLWPSVLVVVGYGLAFYLLAETLKVIPVGIAYAVWAGGGIVLITLVSWWLFDQQLDWPALLGMALILSGVLVLNLFSKAVPH